MTTLRYLVQRTRTSLRITKEEIRKLNGFSLDFEKHTSPSPVRGILRSFVTIVWVYLFQGCLGVCKLLFLDQEIILVIDPNTKLKFLESSMNHGQVP